MLPFIEFPESIFFKLFIIAALIRYRSYAEIGKDGIAGTLERLQLCGSELLAELVPGQGAELERSALLARLRRGEA